MNQNTYNEMDNDLEMGCSNFLENSGDSFFWGLSKKEKRLYKILSEITTETIIGLSIHKRLSNRDLGSFRNMIKELNDQRIDAKKALIRAIGAEAVDLIERISYS